MRKKILYLITKSERGGAQLHLADLFSGFKDRYELGLGVGLEGYITEVAASHSVASTILPDLGNPISPIRDYRAYRQVRRLISDFKPDLIHCHSSKAGVLGRIAAWRLKVPAVFTAHGWAFAEGATFAQRSMAIPVERMTAKTGFPILCVCEKDRKLALKYKIAPAEQLHVIHNGVKDPTGSIASKESQTGLSIGMVARFARPKDYALMTRALTQLDRGTRMIFIGDGPDRGSVEKLSRELGVYDRIEFKGMIQNVRGELARIDVFALATSYEGFPLSVLEGMQMGMPVVASDVGGISEAVVDGETGYLFPRGNCQALVDCLKKLERDRRLASELGRKGRERYEKLFTVERMLDRITAVYSKLLSE